MAELKYLTVSFNEKEKKRIFSKISIDPNTGCWIWDGSQDGGGYGLVWYHNRTERIHRVLYAWKYGPIPRGAKPTKIAQLDHVVCNNTICCNPEHLELVTQKINVLRGNSIIAISARKTHCKYGHKLPERNASGKRRNCPICDRLRHKKRIEGPDRDYWLKKQCEASKRYYWRNKYG